MNPDLFVQCVDKTDQELFMQFIEKIYQGSACSVGEDGTINVTLPRDDSFLPPEVSDKYYSAVCAVMEFCDCTKERAIAALKEADEDIDKAIQMFNPKFEGISHFGELIKG